MGDPCRLKRGARKQHTCWQPSCARQRRASLCEAACRGRLPSCMASQNIAPPQDNVMRSNTSAMADQQTPQANSTSILPATCTSDAERGPNKQVQKHKTRSCQTSEHLHLPTWTCLVGALRLAPPDNEGGSPPNCQNSINATSHRRVPSNPPGIWPNTPHAGAPSHAKGMADARIREVLALAPRAGIHPCLMCQKVCHFSTHRCKSLR